MMYIIPADELKRRLTPHPRTPGVYFLEHDGHLITLYDNGASPTSAQSVQRLLDEFDTLFPVHGMDWTANLTILSLPHGLTFLDQDQHPTQRPDGQELPGLLLLSAGLVGADLNEVLSHELIHTWARWAGMPVEVETPPPRAREFAAIVDINLAQFSATHKTWGKRWQEVLAEYLSAALWDAPLAPGPDGKPAMPHLSPGQYARLARWALRLTPRTRTITLPIGNHIATVDGRAVTLDQPAVVDRATNRTLVPARFIAESLGCRVDWDGNKREVTITQEVVSI